MTRSAAPSRRSAGRSRTSQTSATANPGGPVRKRGPRMCRALIGVHVRVASSGIKGRFRRPGRPGGPARAGMGSLRLQGTAAPGETCEDGLSPRIRFRLAARSSRSGRNADRCRHRRSSQLRHPLGPAIAPSGCRTLARSARDGGRCSCTQPAPPSGASTGIGHNFR